jgi:hypothetical protein
MASICFRRQCLLLGALFVLAAGGPSAAAEPIYQGEKFSRVIEMRAPEAIANAALELGIDRTLPFLIRAMTGYDSAFGEAKQQVWKHLPVQQRYRKQMPVPASSTRIKALMALSEIGIDAQAAVPAVIRHLSVQTNRGDRVTCLSVLAGIGTDSPKAVAELSKAAADPDPVIREGATIGLSFIGPKAASAVPVLLDQLRHPEAATPFIFVALGRMGSAASNAVPVLLDEFRNPSNTVLVLQALHRMGPAAAPAILHLSQLIQQRERNYPLAVEALLNIGAPARECLPLLESLFTDTNAVARVLAAAAVLQIGGANEKALTVLVQELTGADRSRTTWSPPFSSMRGPSGTFSAPLTSAWLLGDCGKTAQTALPALTNAMLSKITWMSVVAARAVWKIDRKPDEVLPVLMEQLKHRGASETDAAMAEMVLAEMGPSAKAAKPLLEDARLHGDRNLRREATLALRHLH